MAKTKIAVCSSNQADQKEIKEQLKHLNYGVVTVTKITNLSAAVLLLGIDENGNAVKDAGSLNDDIRVIYLVPRSRPDILEKLKITAPHEYIHTPVDMKDLNTTIEAALLHASTVNNGSRDDRVETYDEYSNLSTLVRHLPGMAYRCLNDEQWTMLFVSAGCLELTGYEPSELIENNVKSYNDIVFENDRHKVRQEVQRDLKHGRKFTTTYRITTKDGQLKWVWEQGIGIRDDEGKLISIEGFIADITFLKELEKQIKRENLELETILDNLLEHVFYEDKDMTILWANKSACRSLGLPREKVIGQHCYELFAKSERSCKECPVSKAIKTGRPHQTEHTTPDGKSWIIQGSPVSNENDEITAGIEVKLEITDYKQAVTALDRTEKEYNELHENIHDGIVVCDLDRKFVSCNAAFLDMVGYTREELSRMNMRTITPSKWLKQEETVHKQQLMSRGYTDTYRKEYIRKDGSTVWAELRVHLKKDENGEPVGTWAIIRDISQTVRFENDLKENSNLLIATLEATADGILVVNDAGKVLHTNHRFNELWRIPEEIRGTDDNKKLLEFVLNQLDDPEEFSSKVKELYRSDIIDLDFIHFRDGRIYERYSHALMNGKNVSGRVWSFRDITEQKKAENILRANEEKLKAIVENMPMMMAAMDTDGKIVAWNRECEKVTGYSAEEIINNPDSMELFYPDREYRESMIKEWSQTGNYYRDIECEVTCKDGSIKTVAWSSVADRVPIPGWASWDIGSDVTERKKALEKLERLGMAVEQSFDGIIMFDFDENIVYANKTWSEMHGYEPEDTKGQKINLFYSEDKQLKTVVTNLLEDDGTSGWVGMTSHVRKDNTLFQAWETITIIKNRDGKPLGFVGTARDITESRKAEEAMRESEEKYRLLAETASDMILTHDIQGKITYANQAFIDFSGYSKNMLREMRISALIQPPASISKPEKKDLNGSGDIQRLIYEAELVIKNRNRIPVEINSTPFQKDKLQVGRLIIARDISERKQGEKALRESEKKYRRIIDSTIDIIYDITSEGQIIFTSPQVERFGITVDEAIGKSLFDFMHPDDIEKVSNDMRRVIETGEIFPSEFRMIGGNNRIYYMESISKIDLDDDRNIHISGVLRDITERKTAEAALLSSEEKYRILFENANDGIFVAQDEIIKFYNPRVKAITGFEDEELKSHPFSNIIHEEDRALVSQRHWERLEDLDAPGEYNFRIVRKDGVTRWLRINSVKITWENRPATLNFINDITDKKKAEQDLIESEERFRTMADFTYDWESWIGPDGKYVYISPSCERLTGYTAEEFIKNPELLKDIIHTDDREKMNEHMKAHAYNSEAHQVEYRIVARDGSVVWIDHVCQPVYSPEGRYLGRRFSNRDVTEQKQMMITLQESEEKYSTIIEKANDAVLVIQDEKVIFANKALGKITGLTVDEIIGMDYDAMTAPESKSLIHQRYNQRMEGKNPPSFYEFKMINKEGERIDVELSAGLITYRGRKAVVATIRDVSERRKTEAHLRHILAAMEAATEGIAIMNEQKTYTYLNRAMARLFGYATPLEIMLTPWNDILARDDRELLEEVLTETIDKDGYWQNELNGIKKDGTVFPIDLSLTSVGDGNVICIFRDISERKENEIKGQRLQEELERARRMESLGILAGGVAHDLNNMLGPMVGYSDLILEEVDPENKSIINMVNRISKASRIAADVIQDLLTLARRGRYEMETTSLNEVVDNYLDSPSYRHITEEKPGIDVKVDLDPNIGKILGSEPHLLKSIMNLVINAFDAMPDRGTLTITTEQQTLDKLYSGYGYGKIKPGDYIILKIRDTGTGIAREDIDSIFEPYYSKKKMGTSGSGLGLAVVYGIVKDHHGYYDIFSEIGQGTEFVLYFPVSQVEKPKSSVKKIDLSGSESILVVDDTKQQREIAFDLLSSLGYRVETVTNGREAIEYLTDNKVDLVVLDMIMENNFDGLDTYREIIKLHPGQKAIITSGFSITERVDEMQRLGAGAYVKKPYTRQSLGAAVRTELDKKLVPAVVR